MPLQATSGAASYDAFGGGVAAVPNYIEDVFSTWLFNQSSPGPIVNGIDLAGKGGLVWQKPRTIVESHSLIDTVRGASSSLASNLSAAASTASPIITAFNANGFTTGTYFTGTSMASWTFREQPKFFDVVTWSGNGANDRKIAHSLGSVPGCIIVKRTDASDSWSVYHRAVADPEIKLLVLNSTAAAVSNGNVWWGTPPTSTEFTVGGVASVNASGGTYVAYLFAHNAGGFGLTGTDNVISCGSYTTNGAGVGSATLGWEPQWLLIKNASGSGNWIIVDNMRGFLAPGGANSASLAPNNSNSEQTVGIRVNATGFTDPGVIVASGTVIYVAIRRGPMRTPTTGTSVFSPNAVSFAGVGTQITTNFPVDMNWWKNRDGGPNGQDQDRLRGFPEVNGAGAPTLYMDSSTAESSNARAYEFWNTGFKTNNGSPDIPSIFWSFRRAPGFMDICCYTGTGSARTVTHNLTVAPELMIVKRRDGLVNWCVYSQALGPTNAIYLDATIAAEASPIWNNTAPTSSVFSIGGNPGVNTADGTYVAYLFASCPGVSRVGSFTGTGATQVINCGFTGGSRFVLIKATSAAGSWYVWDSARGIVAGNDPYLEINNANAQVTNTDWVDTAASGFELSNAGGNLVNVSGRSYIFLAIA